MTDLAEDTIRLWSGAGENVHSLTQFTEESGPGQFMPALAAAIPSGHPRWRELAAFAGNLDRALERFDLGPARPLVVEEESGAVRFEIRAGYFRVYFVLDSCEEDSGWGLVTHMDGQTEGRIMEGPLGSPPSQAVLSLILRPKQNFRLRAYGDSGSGSGLTIRTRQ